MSGVHSYRAASQVVRGVPVPIGADEFLSISRAATWRLGGAAGAAQQTVEENSDRSATVTITCGEHTVAHATISRLYDAQQRLAQTGAPVVMGPMAFRFANGDLVGGLGMISRPESIDGSVTKADRQWTILIPEASEAYAVGLLASLAAQGVG